MSTKMKGLALASNRPIVGFDICLGSERVAEMVASTAFDFIMVDLLHSHFDKSTATSAIRAIASSDGPVPFARVSDNTPGTINSFLDAGAMGIVVPMVQSADEAKQAVLSTYYPPIGTRSKGSIGSIFYGSDYFTKFNAMVSLIVMIETPEAAMDAQNILSVPGIDGCLIGSGDLSYILKEKNRSNELRTLIHHVLEVGKQVHVPIGLAVSSPDELKSWWNEGIDFFLVSHDVGVLSTALKNHEKKFTGIEVVERV